MGGEVTKQHHRCAMAGACSLIHQAPASGLAPSQARPRPTGSGRAGGPSHLVTAREEPLRRLTASSTPHAMPGIPAGNNRRSAPPPNSSQDASGESLMSFCGHSGPPTPPQGRRVILASSTRTGWMEWHTQQAFPACSPGASAKGPSRPQLEPGPCRHGADHGFACPAKITLHCVLL